jgi:hypothetical protein
MSGGGHEAEAGSFIPESEVSDHMNGIFATLIHAGMEALIGWMFPGTHSTEVSNKGGGGGHH